MAARPLNKDLGDALSRFSSSIVRRSGGLPPNPVPLAQKLVESKVPTGTLERLALRAGLKNVKVPRSNIPPVVISPKFRVLPPSPSPSGRPSKNLGGILHNIQDRIDLHPAVAASTPLPYRLAEQANNSLLRWVQSEERLRSGNPFPTGPAPDNSIFKGLPKPKRPKAQVRRSVQ